MLLAALPEPQTPSSAKGWATAITPQAQATEPILHPERLSGIWEASDSNGGTVGIDLLLTTEVAGLPTSLWGQPQLSPSTDVQVFHQAGPTLQPGELYAFGEHDGLACLSGHRLQGGAPPTRQGYPGIHLDLNYGAHTGTWHGIFHFGAFARTVTLSHPQAGSAQRWPLTGTWAHPSFPTYCLHLARTKTGHLSGWLDTLLFPGLLRYAPGVTRPKQTMEQYGILVDVESKAANGVAVTFSPRSAFCCSSTFLGHVSPDGQRLTGTWDGDNHATEDVSWTRMRDDSCIVRP